MLRQKLPHLHKDILLQPLYRHNEMSDDHLSDHDERMLRKLYSLQTVGFDLLE